jgi:hypothetical protein
MIGRMEPTRSSAAAERFPYGYPGIVCYFELADGQLRKAHTRPDIREAVVRAHLGQSTLYAVWPGRHRSDLFVIDDLPALAAAVAAELPEKVSAPRSRARARAR